MRARISCTHSFFRRDGESQVKEGEAQVKDGESQVREGEAQEKNGESQIREEKRKKRMAITLFEYFKN